MIDKTMKRLPIKEVLVFDGTVFTKEQASQVVSSLKGVALVLGIWVPKGLAGIDSITLDQLEKELARARKRLSKKSQKA